MSIIGAVENSKSGTMYSELRSIHDKQRVSELNCLKIIPPDLKLFDNLSVSSGQESELSGQFSEYEKGEGYVEKRKPEELMKTDLYTYFSYSDEFKSAMESVKNETKISPIERDSEEMQESQIPKKEMKIQNELKRKADDILREIKFVLGEKKISGENDEKLVLGPDSLKVIRKPKEKEKLKIYEDEEYFDTMSGYWRMLSAYDEFQISHPDYNAYENRKPHWLETKPIALEVTENARKKCLEWLKENFENY